MLKERDDLATESVDGSSLAFQGVDDVQGGDGLSLGVVAVGHGVLDDLLEEELQDTPGLVVDQAGDSLDSATARQTADRGFGDAGDVVSQDAFVAGRKERLGIWNHNEKGKFKAK